MQACSKRSCVVEVLKGTQMQAAPERFFETTKDVAAPVSFCTLFRTLKQNRSEMFRRKSS
jgi:hypothetical protein